MTVKLGRGDDSDTDVRTFCWKLSFFKKYDVSAR